jgi:Uncharacterised protein family UPF0547
MEFMILTWIATAIIGGIITQEKGRGFAIGCFLGLLLSIVGVLIAACLSRESKVLATAPVVPPTSVSPRKVKSCPDCAETVLADARICKHCRHVFEPAESPLTSLGPAAQDTRESNDQSLGWGKSWNMIDTGEKGQAAVKSAE